MRIKDMKVTNCGGNKFFKRPFQPTQSSEKTIDNTMDEKTTFGKVFSEALSVITKKCLCDDKTLCRFYLKDVSFSAQLAEN